MRVLIKLEIRRQAELIAISRTRLSDSGQVGTSFDAIGYGSDFFRNCRFRCCCGLNQANIPHDHSKCHRNYGPQKAREVDDAGVQLGFDDRQTLDRNFDP